VSPAVQFSTVTCLSFSGRHGAGQYSSNCETYESVKWSARQCTMWS